MQSRTCHARCFAALAIGLLSGCATVVIPTQVQLASLTPGTRLLALVDGRPSEARDYREEGQGYLRKYLADEGLQPRAFDLVASRLADALPEPYRTRPIEVRRLDVGFLISPNALPTSSDTTLSLASGTSVGVAAVAVLVGYGLIAAINRSRANESGIVFIEVWVGDDQLRSAQNVAITRNVGAAQALESALAAALDELANRARELKPLAETATQD